MLTTFSTFQADPRFVWNKNLMVELIEFKVCVALCIVVPS